MKTKVFLFTFITAFSMSCSETYNCPTLTQDEFSEYLGSFVSYGSQISFTSQNGDSLGFNLVSSFSDPYTCTTEFNSGKDCECRASKSLRDDLPNGSLHNFEIRYSSEELAFTPRQRRTVRIDLDIDELSVGFNTYEDPMATDSLQIRRGSVRYFSDSTINSIKYNQVLVVSELPDSTQQLILSREEGVVGFTDENGMQWYRNF